MIIKSKYIKTLRVSILLFFLTLFTSLDLYSFQAVGVPINIQLSLIKKIFKFDRNFKSRIQGEINVLVVYQRNYRVSLNIRNDIYDLLQSDENQSYEGISVNYKYLNIESAADIEHYVNVNKVNIIYICPLKIIDITSISEITRRNKIISIASMPDYVDDGISIGFDIKDNKPQIYINLRQAKAEGMDFSSQLLKLAKVIQ